MEDFTEFEQRTAYFNGDEIHAIKKGMNILDRIQVSHIAYQTADRRRNASANLRLGSGATGPGRTDQG